MTVQFAPGICVHEGVFIGGMACTHIHVYTYTSFPSMPLFFAYWFLHWSIGMWTSGLFLFQISGKQENTLLNLSFTQKLLLRWGWMSMLTKGKQLLEPLFEWGLYMWTTSISKVCEHHLLVKIIRREEIVS